MKNKVLTTLIVFLLLGLNSIAFAYTIIATETHRGEYEGGKFTKGPGEFKYRFEVDEKAGKVRLTETTRLKNNNVIETHVEYVITTIEDGSSLSSILTSEERRNQRIMTLVGKPGSLATEMILLGEDFFEYCKASSGRFYFATGKVKRLISRDKDIEDIIKSK
jgi:hypothetical protein